MRDPFFLSTRVSLSNISTSYDYHKGNMFGGQPKTEKGVGQLAGTFSPRVESTLSEGRLQSPPERGYLEDMARSLVNELHLSRPSAGSSGELAETERVQQLQAGSEEAFDWLVAQYAPLVYRLAHRLLNDPSDSSDTVQEVFLKVFRSIGHFQGDCSLKTWICHITVNTASNQNRWWRRHRGPECTLEGPEEETGRESLSAASEAPSPFESVLSQETQAIVQKALLRVSESHRLVLVLKEMEGLSYEEVAEILRLSLGTVKSRLARARQSLKRELEAMMEPAPRGVPVWNPAE